MSVTYEIDEDASYDALDLQSLDWNFKQIPTKIGYKKIDEDTRYEAYISKAWISKDSNIIYIFIEIDNEGGVFNNTTIHIPRESSSSKKISIIKGFSVPDDAIIIYPCNESVVSLVAVAGAGGNTDEIVRNELDKIGYVCSSVLPVTDEIEVNKALTFYNEWMNASKKIGKNIMDVNIPPLDQNASSTPTKFIDIYKKSAEEQGLICVDTRYNKLETARELYGLLEHEFDNPQYKCFDMKNIDSDDVDKQFVCSDELESLVELKAALAAESRNTVYWEIGAIAASVLALVLLIMLVWVATKRFAQ